LFFGGFSELLVGQTEECAHRAGTEEQFDPAGGGGGTAPGPGERLRSTRRLFPYRPGQFFAEPQQNRYCRGVARISTGAPFYSLYTGQVSVSYVPDVFGGTRREVESLGALAKFQRFQLEAAYLTLTSNVVATAVQEASLLAGDDRRDRGEHDERQ
jgi:hypothetical protein